MDAKEREDYVQRLLQSKQSASPPGDAEVSECDSDDIDSSSGDDDVDQVSVPERPATAPAALTTSAAPVSLQSSPDDLDSDAETLSPPSSPARLEASPAPDDSAPLAECDSDSATLSPGGTPPPMSPGGDIEVVRVDMRGIDGWEADEKDRREAADAVAKAEEAQRLRDAAENAAFGTEKSRGRPRSRGKKPQSLQEDDDAEGEAPGESPMVTKAVSLRVQQRRARKAARDAAGLGGDGGDAGGTVVGAGASNRPKPLAKILANVSDLVNAAEMEQAAPRRRRRARKTSSGGDDESNPRGGGGSRTAASAAAVSPADEKFSPGKRRLEEPPARATKPRKKRVARKPRKSATGQTGAGGDGDAAPVAEKRKTAFGARARVRG